MSKKPAGKQEEAGRSRKKQEKAGRSRKKPSLSGERFDWLRAASTKTTPPYVRHTLGHPPTDACRVNGTLTDDGWLKQPHLAPVTLIGLWGWVRLLTGCTLSNQRATG